jgi:uncharacterized protein YcgI (DUF1989 family)
VSDFFALAADDHDEWFSSGRTIDYRNGIYVTTGDTLYSNRSNAMATIVADTFGHHDILLTPCSRTPSTCSTQSSTALRIPAASTTSSRVSGRSALSGPDLDHAEHLHERLDRPDRGAAHRRADVGGW